MKALIHGTRICDVVTTEFPVNSDLVWVDVADDTTTQDTYVDGAVVKYTEPPLTWLEIRQQRNALLAASDWRAMPDAPTMSDAWTTYREALRNLPSTESDPADIVFPTEPT